MRKLFLLCAMLLASSLVLAANDPGHDSLYVLLVGDSNISGSLNITQNLTAQNIRAAALLYGDQLDIRANGSIFTPSSRPAIQSDANDLYFDSRANVYVNTRAGTTGVVQVGPTSGSSITLNVSGTIRQQNVAVCLSNGTNCPGALGSANITGSGTTGYVARWASGSDLEPSVIYDDGTNVGIGTETTTEKLTVSGGINASGTIYQANVAVCLSDGTNCPAAGGGGWTNSSTQVWLANNATNVSVGFVEGVPVLYVNTANAAVGIGTVPSTSYRLHVSHTLSQLLLENPDWNDAMSSQAGLHVRFSANSTIDNNLILTQTDYDADTEGLRTPFIVKSSGRVGTNTGAPTQALHVNGSVNVSTGNLSIQTNYSMCFNSACSARIYHNGSALIIEGT